MTPRGSAQSRDSSGNPAFSDSCGAEVRSLGRGAARNPAEASANPPDQSAALLAGTPAAPIDPAKAPTMPSDPDLAAVASAWPLLPPAVRAGIVAMVRASQ